MMFAPLLFGQMNSVTPKRIVDGELETRRGVDVSVVGSAF